MRVFVGIPLPSAMQNTIGQWQELYQERVSPQGFRWMKKENLHITLIPPWEEEDVPSIIDTLHKHSQRRNFPIVFQKILFMPNKKVKYLWITGDTPLPLIDLRNEISINLRKEIERRPFRMHVTIARLQKDAIFSPIEESVDWKFDVVSFALLQSHLLATGAEYKVLETFPLI